MTSQQSQFGAGALAGMRVLDVSQVMAGPFCCMMLGDMGADVIKVEPPQGGDQTRRAMGFKLKGDDSLGFLNMNRNKRSITIDLKSDEGREIFYALARTADVIVENYRPGTMKKLGIDYDTISKINPGIIYASISGFGQSGPWADRPGFDLIAQAATGVMSITGHPGGPPAKSGVPVTDIGCSLFALYAILTAYIGRQKSGEGQHIDASLYDAGIAFAVWDICEYWGTGNVPERIGTANRMAAPYQAVEASDGYFVFGANNDRLYRRLCEVIGRPDLLDNPDYATNALRMANREALIGALEKSFVQWTRAECVDMLLAVGIPAGPINDYAEALENEHARERDVVMKIDHPIEGEVNSIGFPVRLSGTPQQVRRPPPLLGEHTAEILAELGIKPAAAQ
ncbi:formyl-CoA transferase [Devosia subaequoris]|uniref:Formyl-CoA transferase n=1 Tax=Devosia subaequoris TaxID=395930 RepID=A0A7W6IQS0_9HYPH|nr:CoA transferase [Devosia subaequoris]MBB4053944.1 formyl-CoA transferase [Devosia subaequoris]MCP1211448.1 CoA transferase [Devosia subaequoris]